MLCSYVTCFLQQVTCGRHPLGANFHDATRCVLTSVQLFERRRWGWCCSRRRWRLRHSEVNSRYYCHLNTWWIRFAVEVMHGCCVSLAGTGDELLHLWQELGQEILRSCWWERLDHSYDQTENNQLWRRQEGRFTKLEEIVGSQRVVLQWRFDC